MASFVGLKLYQPTHSCVGQNVRECLFKNLQAWFAFVFVDNHVHANFRGADQIDIDSGIAQGFEHSHAHTGVATETDTTDGQLGGRAIALNFAISHFLDDFFQGRVGFFVVGRWAGKANVGAIVPADVLNDDIDIDPFGCNRFKNLRGDAG